MEILKYILVGILCAIGGAALMGFHFYLRDINQRLKKMEDAKGKRLPYFMNDGLEELMAHKLTYDRAIHYFESHLESMAREINVIRNSSAEYDEKSRKLRNGEKLD